MVSQCIRTHSPEETIQFGRRLAARCEPPLTVLLIGDLGAGKTTLAKGLVAGLAGVSEEEVTSPTFTLVHEYEGSNPLSRVYHVDLYRIENPQELGTLGLEDLLAEQAVVIVEWGEKLGPFFRRAFPEFHLLEIRLRAVSDTQRRIEMEGGECLDVSF